MCPSNPASSVSLAEDLRDPRAGTHPRSGGHSGFNPHAWTSKCAPRAPKGCWERCTQANTCSLETRAAVPHFWLTECSPNLLWASGRMNRAAHDQGCWQRTAQPKDWHHGHSYDRVAQELFSMQNPKMHGTSYMFLRTQAQGTMNTCEAELRDLCLSKTRPFNAKATSRGTKLTEGQKHISQGTSELPRISIIVQQQAREEETKVSECCHTGHGMLVKTRKQEGQRFLPR